MAIQLTDQREHWDSIYEAKLDSEVSWTESEPQLSLSLIHEVSPNRRIIDIGGGTSVLVDRLLDRGHSIAVLDVSRVAIARAQARLGERARSVRWIVSDVTSNPDLETADVWHDRAVFHFLTNGRDRAAYVALLTRTIIVGGHVILATFAPDGPRKCSGLPVQQYDGPSLAAQLGDGFARIKTISTIHMTPWGSPQSFQYSVFRKTGT